ncbi:DUF3302 domain-containing protein [Variovorax sp. GT1P44]|uniref:DUF3302 domain-containing protein n=1 Tax=Variovorax sp. GT1P44 TaxID=3443742 RepID=UPI003F47E56A
MHLRHEAPAETRGGRLRARLLAAVALASAWTPPAHASLLEGEALDTAADVMSYVVLLLVPCLAIALFWIVHVMPEKIAKKRHHPQKAAIHTLCLLSLVFGGLLWPIAWLWAYTRPIGYKLAFGTEKHEDFFVEHGEKALRDELGGEHVDPLLGELDVLERHGHLTPELKRVRERVLAAQERISVAAEMPPARAA